MQTKNKKKLATSNRHSLTKIAVAYKDKFFIIHDKSILDDDELYFARPHIDIDKLDLQKYVARCIHYNIPFYIGHDKEFENKLTDIACKLVDSHKH